MSGVSGVWPRQLTQVESLWKELAEMRRRNTALVAQLGEMVSALESAGSLEERLAAMERSVEGAKELLR